MTHFIKLDLTRPNERSKVGRKREPATGSEHLLVGIKIVIPVLPSIGAYISDDAKSCANDIGDFAPSRAKMAVLL